MTSGGIDAKGRSYLFHGTQGLPVPLTDGSASVQIQVKGKTDTTSGYFIVTSATMALQLAVPGTRASIVGKGRAVK